jgi:hypothetical protein
MMAMFLPVRRTDNCADDRADSWFGYFFTRCMLQLFFHLLARVLFILKASGDVPHMSRRIKNPPDAITPGLIRQRD